MHSYCPPPGIAVFLMLCLSLLGESKGYAQHAENWKAYNDSALVYKNQKNNQEAITWYEKARTVLARDSTGTDSYGVVCENMGDLYYQLGNYRQAGRMYEEAVAIETHNHGNTDTVYANYANNMSVNSIFAGEYDKARTLLNEALTIRRRYYLEQNRPSRGVAIPYISSCIYLANLDVTTGDFVPAEPLYQEAKAILEKDSLTVSNSYAQCCNGLASLYLNRGEYEKAEPLALKSRQVRGVVMGLTHPTYALSCLTLANLYKAMGQYEKAEPLYVEARRIRLAYYKDQHPLYAASCNILADLYYQMGQTEKAEALFLEAKAIREKIPGKGPGNHGIDYAETCNNLALLYNREEKYHEAEALALEAKEIWDSTLAPEHMNHAINGNLLGSIYYGLGDYKKALGYYRQAGEYWQTHLGRGHPYCIQNSNNQAKASWNLKDTGTARRLYREAWLSQYGLIRDVFQFTSEKEKEQYIRNSIVSGDEYQSFYLQEYAAGCAGELYDLSLNSRSLILSSAQHTREVIRKSGDPLQMRTYARWMGVKQQLAYIYSNGNTIDDGKTRKMEEEADSLEKDLTRRASVIGKPGPSGLGGRSGAVPGWQAIRKKLGKGEAAIEFEQYRYYTGKRWTDSTYTIALLLRADAEQPRVIRLFEESQLDSVLAVTGEDAGEAIGSIYSRGLTVGGRPKISRGLAGAGSRGIPQGGSQNASRPAAGSLYRLAWKPIEPYLSGIHKIFFAPAGQLHRVAFAAIPVNPKQLLSDKYQLVQLNSTAAIASGEESYIRSSDGIRLYGGVNYDADSLALKKAAGGYYAVSGYYKEGESGPVNKVWAEEKGKKGGKEKRVGSRGGSRGESWNYLPGTEEEILAIQKLGRSLGRAMVALSGAEASEESLKALNGLDTPAVLHIATHGYFFPDPVKDAEGNDPDVTGDPGGRSGLGGQEGGVTNRDGRRFRESKDPLFRSGILLAGANNTWNGHPVAGLEDGMLTSYEVSNLYFPGMKLVVLSACETALGSIEGSEGVYGLQRAFTMAGAKNLVMSLWKVPDAETSEFMQLFYKDMLGGRSVGDSFYHTQTIMKSRYRGDPYKWAAWILIRG